MVLFLDFTIQELLRFSILNIVTLYYGDCLVDMNHILNGSFDLILTVLPYGVLNKDNPNAKWDSVIPLDLLWNQYKRVLKDSGVVVLFGQGMFTAQVMMSNQKWWKYNLIWDKQLTTGFLNAKKMPLRVHEDIMVFYDKSPTYNPQMVDGVPSHSKGTKVFTKEVTNYNYGNYQPIETEQTQSTKKYPKSILSFQKPHPSKAVHQTQKPTDLLEWLINTYSNSGETVLDSCMGSGSTGVACINTDRNFIGIEMDEHYFNVAQERIKKAQEAIGLWG